jgi:hypothetical protein
MQPITVDPNPLVLEGTEDAPSTDSADPLRSADMDKTDAVYDFPSCVLDVPPIGDIEAHASNARLFATMGATAAATVFYVLVVAESWAMAWAVFALVASAIGVVWFLPGGPLMPMHRHSFRTGAASAWDVATVVTREARAAAIKFSADEALDAFLQKERAKSRADPTAFSLYVMRNRAHQKAVYCRQQVVTLWPGAFLTTTTGNKSETPVRGLFDLTEVKYACVRDGERFHPINVYKARLPIEDMGDLESEQVRHARAITRLAGRF